MLWLSSSYLNTGLYSSHLLVFFSTKTHDKTLDSFLPFQQYDIQNTVYCTVASENGLEMVSFQKKKNHIRDTKKDGRNALCPGVEWQWTLSHSLGCECDLTDLKINSSLWIQWVLKRYGNLDLPAVASLPVAQDRQAETSHDVRGHAVGEIGIYVERRFYPSSSWSGQGPEWALLVRVEGKILRSSSPLGSG